MCAPLYDFVRMVPALLAADQMKLDGDLVIQRPFPDRIADAESLARNREGSVEHRPLRARADLHRHGNGLYPALQRKLPGGLKTPRGARLDRRGLELRPGVCGRIKPRLLAHLGVVRLVADIVAAGLHLDQRRGRRDLGRVIADVTAEALERRLDFRAFLLEGRGDSTAAGRA